jgi:predicted small lipoprotein YifL
LSPFRDRRFLRLALIGALMASLGLAACGRKGALDPPPGASLTGEQSAAPSPMANPIASPIGGHAKDDNPGMDASGRALAPKGQKKQIPIDVLLN